MSASDKIKDRMRRMRPMAVLVDGIWQKAEGVWLDVHNCTARCFLNGRELVCDQHHFIDLNGYGPADIAGEIVRRNISTLPKRPQKKMPAPEPPREYGPAVYRNYRVVRRGDGQLHALPYREADMAEEQAILRPPPGWEPPPPILYQIIEDEPPLASNNE